MLDNVRKSGKGWVASCPLHRDEHPSLSIGIGEKGLLLLKCFSCEAPYVEIMREIEKLQDDSFAVGIGPVKKAAPFAAQEEAAKRAITLTELAAAKKLPIDFLRQQCHLADAPFKGGVEIYYLDFDGLHIAVKTRTALKAKEGSKWPYRVRLALYGLWRLRADLRRNRGEFYVVEGESDCWTFWYQGFAALGVPGASAFKLIDAEHLIGVRQISVICEPDAAGRAFAAGVAARLRALGWNT